MQRRYTWIYLLLKVILVSLLCKHTAASLGYLSQNAAACPDFSEYTRLHWGILLQNSNIEQRWLVTEDPDGIADRYVNAVAAFYIALLTKRALCIRPALEVPWRTYNDVPGFVPHEQPGLQVALDSPFILWNCQDFYPANDAAGYTKGVVTIDTTQWGALGDPTSNLSKAFRQSDFSPLGNLNATTWLLYLHKGQSIGLFNNHHFQQQLVSLGLRPDTAFGCAMQYLFRPSMSTLRLAPLNLLSVMTDEAIYKIGIQVRLGDQLILNQTDVGDVVWNSIVQPFFHCAQQLEDSLVKVTGYTQKVKWFLFTDSVSVRDRAQELYGSSKVLAFKDTAIEYYETATDKGLQLTVLEHWLFQQAHYHIITRNSGMGRTAAFASLRFQNVFTMEWHANAQAPAHRYMQRSCQLHDHDRPLDIYDHWSGI